LQTRTIASNAPRTTRAKPCPLQTVLGGFSERQTPYLKTRTTADLTKLLHELLTFATTKKPELPTCSLFKDQRPIENNHVELRARHTQTATLPLKQT
jgi:hypothetical protein